MITEVLTACDKRYQGNARGEKCGQCTYGDFCPSDCEKCLDFIHTPSHAEPDAPERKYDVWTKIHSEIKTYKSESRTVKFFYKDMCDFIQTIGKGTWIPDLVTFQYEFILSINGR